MTGQTTADLWMQLCRDLQAQQSSCAAEERAAIVKRFLESANTLFKSPSVRLRDASEIAGDCLLGIGMDEDALACFEDALTRSEGALDARARIATKTAMLLEGKAGSKEQARDAYQIAISCFAIIDTSQLPTLLNNLASIQLKLGEFDNAVDSYQRAVTIAGRIHGTSSMDVALLQSNLAVAYTNHGDYAKAEGLHLQALAIREAQFGSNHPEVASSMANLGVLYHDKGEFRKAEKFYKGALETLKRFREPTDPEVKAVRANFERLPHIAVRMLSTTDRL
jgi:tetratricopeptide (TPR) repeat protein